jgi:hypothetical protein
VEEEAVDVGGEALDELEGEGAAAAVAVEGDEGQRGRRPVDRIHHNMYI